MKEGCAFWASHAFPAKVKHVNQGLKILPLGGVGEIGMNMMVLQTGKQAMVVDCGVRFSDGRLPGIDLIVPDFSYVLNPDLDVLGIVLTHGHEDHIGALPYLLRQRKLPLYSSKFTLGMIARKLREHELEEDIPLHEVKGREQVRLGPFEVEFIEMSHSISESFGLAIDTPEGKIIHTGDFKIDEEPADGRFTDLERLNELGDQGVSLLLSDSTNSGSPGRAGTELSVREDLEKQIAGGRGWVVLVCFSSHIPRIRQVLDIAKKLGKRVYVSGRSLKQNIEVARQTGLLESEEPMWVEKEDLSSIPRDKLIILSTGTQGEVRSALSRIALGQDKRVQLLPKDRVILSSRFIPGNERAIYAMINQLYRRGAEVVTWKEAHVHVSGHAHREELEELFRAVRPHFFMPVHGEFRHLIQHAEIAKGLGLPEERIFLIEDGESLFLKDRKVEKYPAIELIRSVVDGTELVTMGSEILRDRRHLSATGLVVAVVVVDQKTGKVVQEPQLLSRGVACEGEAEGLLDEALGVLLDCLDDVGPELCTDADWAEEEIRLSLRRFFKRRLDRKPVVLPIVLEV